MSTSASTGTERSGSCPTIAVLVVGAAAMDDQLVSHLRSAGHPVELSATPLIGGSTTPAVIVLRCQRDECCALADALHRQWSQAPVIVISDHVSNELEDQIATREFATLRKRTPNHDEIHTL